LLLEAGERFVGYRGDFYWSDVGTLEAYRRAQLDVLSGKVQVSIPGEHLKENLWIEEGAHLHRTAALKGTVVIGQDAMIGREVTLFGDITVGLGCWIHSKATVKSSVLLPGSCVGSGAYLEDCIVGSGYDVRPGECIRGGALSRHVA
jgi:mannose-1-phosphate guanylyltransferase